MRATEQAMPSRTIVIAVFCFWIASTTWLVIREIVPLYRAGEPPAFTIDITAEAGGSRSSWTIKFNGQNVGSGFSGVKPRPDRTFDLFSEWHFVNFRPLNIGEIKKIKGWYRVDKDGNLKELQAELGVVLGRDEWLGEAKGVVKDDLLLMSRQVSVGGVPVDLSGFQPKPIAVPAHGSILNSMHLLDRIPGLRVGRSWEVPLLDPLSLVLLNKTTLPSLIAQVHQDQLVWQGQSVRCYRIDYAEPGKSVTARTWVRMEDDLVLQQEAGHKEMELMLIREVTK
jgi:hypothetical protein